jgi:hypothetical protein
MVSELPVFANQTSDTILDNVLLQALEIMFATETSNLRVCYNRYSF